MSEKQIDALFRRIVQNDAEEESKKLMEQRSEHPGDAVPALSRAHFEKMLDRELSDEHAQKSKKDRKPWLSKTAKRIIAAAAVFVFVTFGLMMTSEAVRGRITQFVVSLFPGYAEVGLDNIDELPPSDKVIYRLTYVPDGFRLVSEAHDVGQQLRYRRGEEELLEFDVYTATAVSQISTDDAVKVEHITMHGEDALLIVYEDGFAQIAWSNEQYLFLIEGMLSEEEILKVADGVTVAEDYPEADPEDPEEPAGTGNVVPDDSSVILEDCYDLGYLPEGFEQTYWRKNPSQLFRYQREKKQLAFLVLPNAEAETPDTQNAVKVEQITVNGCDGLLIVRRDWIMVTWSDETDTFQLEGNVSEEEMLKIANSVFYGKVIIQP